MIGASTLETLGIVAFQSCQVFNVRGIYDGAKSERPHDPLSLTVTISH